MTSAHQQGKSPQRTRSSSAKGQEPGLRAPSIEERWAAHYDMCCWGWRDPPDYEPEMETARQLMLAVLERARRMHTHHDLGCDYCEEAEELKLEIESLGKDA